MATSEQFQERLRQAVREAVRKVLAKGDLPVREPGEVLFTAKPRYTGFHSDLHSASATWKRQIVTFR